MIIDVPQHYQSKKDSACGPMAIRMAADYYYFKNENREMTATEWLTVLEITMNKNILRSGTKKENIVKALRKIGFATKAIEGSNYESRVVSIEQAISRKHPVIVYCRIRATKKPKRHFAVVVGIDQDSIYIRDPYPGKRKTGKHRKIGLNVFKAITPEIGGLVWGRVKWGIEVIK